MVLRLKLMGKPTTYKYQVLDRTKVLHSSRTQTYGETNYLSQSSFGQNQDIAWSSDSNLWGNQLLINIKFWTEPRYCMVLWLKPMGKPTTYHNQVLDRTKVLHGPRTQTYGETNYLKIKFWTESRYCMVFGLKSMGKPTTYKYQVLDRIKVLHGPRTQTYGKASYLIRILSCSILGSNNRRG